MYGTVMAKKRRPCPRQLYDGCPIPRELCTEDFQKTGEWHCLKFLKEFEWFVFGTGEADTLVRQNDSDGGQEIVSMEDLMRVLEGWDGEG